MIPTLVIVCALAALWVLFEQAAQLKRQAERIVYLQKRHKYDLWRIYFLQGAVDDMTEKTQFLEERLLEVN